MNATTARDRVVDLAKQDTKRAVVAARKIPHPWYRAQALAWAARFAPTQQVTKLCGESLLACRECSETFKRTGASAWALRALIERGAIAQAEKEVLPIIAELSNVEPSASRSQAAFLPYQATFDLGTAVRERFLRELLSASEAYSHWRAQRNLIDALSMLSETDARLSTVVIQRIKDEKFRRKALKVAGEHKLRKPRPFFW